MRGAVLVRVSGRAARTELADDGDLGDGAAAPSCPNRIAYGNERLIPPTFVLTDQIMKGGILAVAVLIPALALSAGTVVLEAVLFRGLLELTEQLAIFEQRITALGLVAGFLALRLVL